MKNLVVQHASSDEQKGNAGVGVVLDPLNDSFPSLWERLQDNPIISNLPESTELYSSGDYVYTRALFYPFLLILGPYATIGSLFDYIYSAIDTSAESKLRMEYYSEYKAGPYETLLSSTYRIFCEPWIFLYHFTLTLAYLIWPVLSWLWYFTWVLLTLAWEFLWYNVAFVWLVTNNYYYSIKHMINHYPDFLRNDWLQFTILTWLFPIGWLNQYIYYFFPHSS